MSNSPVAACTAETHAWAAYMRIKGFLLVRCGTCGLIATQRHLQHPPREEYDIDATVEEDVRRYLLPACRQAWEQARPAMNRYRSNGRLLEVGAGLGAFLEQATSWGWEATGVEPGDYPSRDGLVARGVRLLHGRVEDLPQQESNFDVVVLWDVIEHVSDPEELIRRCLDRLRPGGLLLLRTPDAAALETATGRLGVARAYAELLYPANPAQHIWHFTESVLARLIVRAGGRPLDTERQYYPVPGEVIGRNRFVTLLKLFVHRACCDRPRPYEFTLMAERQ